MKRKPATAATSPEEFTASRFAALVGCDRHELARKLEVTGATPVGKKNGGAVYRLKDLVIAFAGGDERAERMRKLRAEAEKVELQNMRSRGELIEVASVKKLGERVMIAVRNRILNMPLTDDEKDSCLRELLALAEMDWSREA